MLVTPERIVYSGYLGRPSCRVFGAFTLYIAHETAFDLTVDGEPPVRAWLAAVPVNRPHHIASSDRLIRDILIEPECVPEGDALALLSTPISERSAQHSRMASAFDHWLANNSCVDRTASNLDQFFFGRALGPRTLDRRIQRVVESIRSAPFEQFTASKCALLTGLSFSRFVHLFKQEIGMTFRSFCAWKRARAVLPSMTTPCNLTRLALDAGYPDSTHFSHSMRRIFGLRPRDILAGSQRLSPGDAQHAAT